MNERECEMRQSSGKSRTLVLVGVLVVILALFFFVGMRSGPLAPVPVTVVTVEERALVPALFGIGTVEARYLHRIGPSIAGRLGQLKVDVGDPVRKGQVLGEMDPVDLHERITAQAAAIARAQAAVPAVEARIQDVSVSFTYARAQKKRYEELFLGKAASDEVVEAKRREYQAAEAALQAARADLDAARQEVLRQQAEYQGLLRRREELRLIAPIDGLVTARLVEPGSAMAAGQPVVEVIDPASVWIDTRFDQLGAAVLRVDQKARIALRSGAGQPLAGEVARVEPLADAVTEELLAKVVFAAIPNPLPSLGELAEVTVTLPALAQTAVVPNAAVRRDRGQLGVWALDGTKLRFAPVRLGGADLEGNVQILEGLKNGERIVLYSQRPLTERSRIKIVKQVAGARP